MSEILNHVWALIYAVRARYSTHELHDSELGKSIAALESWIARIESLDKTMTKQRK